MRMKLVLYAFAAIGLLFPLFASAQSTAITNARIVTVSGATIERGTIVIRDGLIEAVGANARVPADAVTIDGSGLTIYPGFIDSLTNLGLAARPATTPGPGGVCSQFDACEWGFDRVCCPQVSWNAVI